MLKDVKNVLPKIHVKLVLKDISILLISLNPYILVLKLINVKMDNLLTIITISKDLDVKTVKLVVMNVNYNKYSIDQL